jgi:hypothetical protein
MLTGPLATVQRQARADVRYAPSDGAPPSAGPSSNRTFFPVGVLLHEANRSLPLSKFQFAICSGPESIRKAGVVESDSFDEAVTLLGEKITVRAGDSLEIGVTGFPPARYQCIGAVKNGRPVWVPEGQMAA